MLNTALHLAADACLIWAAAVALLAAAVAIGMWWEHRHPLRDQLWPPRGEV